MAEEAKPKLKFRNYQPRSDELQGLKAEPSAAADDADDAEEPVKNVVHEDATQEPLLNLAPKLANWDQKRSLEPALKRLRAATDRAIVTLIARRVAEEEQQQQQQGDAPERVDLASAVARQQKLGDDPDAD